MIYRNLRQCDTFFNLRKCCNISIGSAWNRPKITEQMSLYYPVAFCDRNNRDGQPGLRSQQVFQMRFCHLTGQHAQRIDDMHKGDIFITFSAEKLSATTWQVLKRAQQTKIQEICGAGHSYHLPYNRLAWIIFFPHKSSHRVFFLVKNYRQVHSSVSIGHWSAHTSNISHPPAFHNFKGTSFLAILQR